SSAVVLGGGGPARESPQREPPGHPYSWSFRAQAGWSPPRPSRPGRRVRSIYPGCREEAGLHPSWSATRSCRLGGPGRLSGGFQTDASAAPWGKYVCPILCWHRGRLAYPPNPRPWPRWPCGLLGPEGEAGGPSCTVDATQEGFTALVQTVRARGAVPAATLVGLEATGHYWENLEAHLVHAGYRVLLLAALQTRRYRDVLRRKAKTDDIDAYVVAGLLRSGSAEGCFVPNEQIQSLRELARLRGRLMRERQDY